MGRVVLKFYPKGIPHPRGTGWFGNRSTAETHGGYLLKETKEKWEKRMNEIWPEGKEPRVLADDAWIYVWEEEENEFGLVSP